MSLESPNHLAPIDVREESKNIQNEALVNRFDDVDFGNGSHGEYKIEENSDRGKCIKAVDMKFLRKIAEHKAEGGEINIAIEPTKASGIEVAETGIAPEDHPLFKNMVDLSQFPIYSVTKPPTDRNRHTGEWESVEYTPEAGLDVVKSSRPLDEEVNGIEIPPKKRKEYFSNFSLLGDKTEEEVNQLVLEESKKRADEQIAFRNSQKEEETKNNSSFNH